MVHTEVNVYFYKVGEVDTCISTTSFQIKEVVFLCKKRGEEVGERVAVIDSTGG